MRKYAALIAYTGTDYCGWQRQKGSAADGGPSIQATLESALRQITCEENLSLVGSGRTDSGVHATGQVAHFVIKREKEWDPSRIRLGLNSILPASIRIQEIKPVALDFHAQRSAVKKQYSYYFQQGPCALPHLEPYSWWIKKRLDLDAMNAALGYLKGKQDFKPFQASGAAPMITTVREILEAEVTWEPLPFPGHTPVAGYPMGLVRMRLIGTGFLKQMVRGIAGTLLQVGENRRDFRCFEEILRSQDRRAVGPTAPARALWLERVWYEGLNWC